MSDIHTKTPYSQLSNEESNKMTKKCLQSALVLLIKERDFQDISITDICKKAGVSRPAYYRNYNSKEDILRSFISYVVNDITNAMSKYDFTKDMYNFWLTMFEKIALQADTFTILLKAGLADAILTEINDFFHTDTQKMCQTRYYNLCFWTGAVYNILKEWIRNDMQPSSPEMAKELCQMLQNMEYKF